MPERKNYKKKPAAKSRYARGRYAYKRTAAANRAGREYVRKEKDPGFIAAGGNALGAAIGTAVGGPAGGALGSFLGGKLGHLVETITGFGDYKIKNNSIMNGGMTPPQIVNSIDNGGFIIRHREYIADILSTQDFTIQKFPLNPGQNISFPWLSQIAANFDQYRWRGIIFEFKSTSADAVFSEAASGALGSISMASDYDVLDPPYTNKREMLNSLFANSTKPSCNMIHPIECKANITPMSIQYVRTGGFPENSDARMYDLGNTYVATDGMQQNGGVVGELWVTYEVEFFKQQVASEADTDNFKITNVAAGTWLGLGANSHPGDPANTIGGKINDAGVTYSFPNTVGSGLYLCTYTVFGTSATIGEISLTLAGCSLFDVWNAATNFVQAPVTGSTSTSLMAQFVVKVNRQAPSITFNTAAVPTSSGGNFIVTKIETNLSDF